MARILPELSTETSAGIPGCLFIVLRSTESEDHTERSVPTLNPKKPLEEMFLHSPAIRHLHMAPGVGMRLILWTGGGLHISESMTMMSMVSGIFVVFWVSAFVRVVLPLCRLGHSMIAGSAAVAAWPTYCTSRYCSRVAQK